MGGARAQMTSLLIDDILSGHATVDGELAVFYPIHMVRFLPSLALTHFLPSLAFCPIHMVRARALRHTRTCTPCAARGQCCARAGSHVCVCVCTARTQVVLVGMALLLTVCCTGYIFNLCRGARGPAAIPFFGYAVSSLALSDYQLQKPSEGAGPQ